MAERLQKVEHTWIDDESGKTRSSVTEFDDKGAAQAKGGGDEQVAQGELPADFPGRDIFRRAGYGTIEALRQFRRRGPFTRIEGVDSLTAQAAEFLLAQTPEDAQAASAVTAADAKAGGLNTKVSKGGGGSEATTEAVPDGTSGDAGLFGAAKGTKLDEAAEKVEVDAPKPKQAGHGQEGFQVSAGSGKHTTTNLSEASGATKVAGSPDAEEAKAAAQPSQPKGKLPSSFPHLTVLNKAGVNTWAQLRKYEDDYTQIPSVGDAFAKDIADGVKYPPAEEE